MEQLSKKDVLKFASIGVWSSVCQYGFNTIDGYVFCSQLGYNGASE